MRTRTLIPIVVSSAVLTLAAAWGQGPAVDLEFELDPIVITAPRMKIPKTLIIAPQINAQLLRLLQQRSEARPDEDAARMPSVEGLRRLTTLTGYKLIARYTELGFLLTEGLAGVTDYQLANAVEGIAARGGNPQTRASAMVALAYTKDARYLTLFQQGMSDSNITVRLGALESLMLLDNPAALFNIMDAARNDPWTPLRVIAAAGAWRKEDLSAREILLSLMRHEDWLARALAVRYLGEQGGRDEYDKLLSQLNSESNASVKAELCLALIRLRKYLDR